MEMAMEMVAWLVDGKRMISQDEPGPPQNPKTVETATERKQGYTTNIARRLPCLCLTLLATIDRHPLGM